MKEKKKAYHATFRIGIIVGIKDKVAARTQIRISADVPEEGATDVKVETAWPTMAIAEVEKTHPGVANLAWASVCDLLEYYATRKDERAGFCKPIGRSGMSNGDTVAVAVDLQKIAREGGAQ